MAQMMNKPFFIDPPRVCRSLMKWHYFHGENREDAAPHSRPHGVICGPLRRATRHKKFRNTGPGDAHYARRRFATHPPRPPATPRTTTPTSSVQGHPRSCPRISLASSRGAEGRRCTVQVRRRAARSGRPHRTSSTRGRSGRYSGRDDRRHADVPRAGVGRAAGSDAARVLAACGADAGCRRPDRGGRRSRAGRARPTARLAAGGELRRRLRPCGRCRMPRARGSR